MSLKYPSEWKFEGIGFEIPPEANSEFSQLIEKIAAGNSNPQQIFEAFKTAFGDQSVSSSASWAESDLATAMREARSNAASYIASVWEGMKEVQQFGVGVPSVNHVNKILDKWDIPLVVDPPNLRMKEGDVVFRAADTETESSSASATYSRGDEIGRGGFGIVYRVTRTTKIGQFDFAMKVLNPSSFVTNKERAMLRFQREMQALRKLQHRGIVSLIEAGLDGDQKPYILMPLIEGPDLLEYLSGEKPAKIFAVFNEILSVLEYAHKEGVVHRDLKPSNILVRSSDGQPFILDFGCAYLFDDADESDLTTTHIGSRPYMPIEVIRNPRHRSTKHDIYACGLLLYRVLAGRLPDPDDYSPIEEQLDGCAGLDQLIQSAIAPERRRIESAALFRRRIESIASGI